MQFLSDEHIPGVLRAEVLHRAPELTIWRIGTPGAPALGTPDPQILRWCEARAFLPFTGNRRSMPKHLADHLKAGRHVPGILIPRPNATFGQVLDELILIALAGQPDDFRDRIRYVPLEY
jgi:hypothetical protein